MKNGPPFGAGRLERLAGRRETGGPFVVAGPQAGAMARLPVTMPPSRPVMTSSA